MYEILSEVPPPPEPKSWRRYWVHFNFLCTFMHVQWITLELNINLFNIRVNNVGVLSHIIRTLKRLLIVYVFRTNRYACFIKPKNIRNTNITRIQHWVSQTNAREALDGPHAWAIALISRDNIFKLLFFLKIVIYFIFSFLPKYIEKNIFFLYIYAWNKQIIEFY